MGGYLYIFQEEGTKDFYKVGVSENWPDIRKGQLQTGNPRRLIKITYIKLRHYKAVETLTKHRLKHYGTDGGTEWYNCPLNTVLDTVNLAVSEVEYKRVSEVFKAFHTTRLTALTLYERIRKTLMGILRLLAHLWTVVLLAALFGAAMGVIVLEFNF
jgi:hypothetical protein